VGCVPQKLCDFKHDSSSMFKINSDKLGPKCQGNVMAESGPY
jgi:hypothetical protein